MSLSSQLPCPDCGVPMKTKIIEYVSETKFGKIIVPDISASVCDACGTQWFGPSTCRKIDAAIELKKTGNHHVE